MALKEACGNSCSDCEKICHIDEQIPCSPDCDNLTKNENIKVEECLKAGCDTIKYIFDAVSKTDKEIIKEYGEVTKFPYSLDERSNTES